MNTGNKNRPYDQGFPLYLSGDQTILDIIKLRLQTSITISALPQKTFIVSMPFKILTRNQIKEAFYSPIVQVQIIGQAQRQNFIKNKSLIREGVHYIYFPAGIRVDQKIYKIYLTNYENLLDKLSRSQKINFSKYIIWQNGKGQHSLNFQANKVIDNLSITIKNQIQKKVQQSTTEIRSIQSQKMGIKQLKRLFILKNKLSFIFKQIRLNQLSNDVLQSLWRQILNERETFLSKIAIVKKGQQQVIYPFKAPFLVYKLSYLVKGFQTPQNYMSILTFSFYQMFKSFILSMQHYQAIIRLRYFIDSVNNNILKKATEVKNQVSRYIWLIELMDHCEYLLKNNASPPMKNTQEEYEKRQISIWGTHRFALQRIGYILYDLSNFNGFPRSLQQELLFVLQKIRNKNIKQSIVKENPSLSADDLINLKQQEPQSMQRQISNNMLKVITNFTSYSEVYVSGLIKVYKVLNIQNFYRTAQSLKLTVMKSIILYMYDSTLMHQYNYNFRNSFQYKQIQKWSQLKTLHDIFKLPFQKIQGKNDDLRATLIELLTDKGFQVNVDFWRMILKQLKENCQSKDRFSLGQIDSINFSRRLPSQSLQAQQLKSYEVKIALKKWDNRYFIYQKIWIICVVSKQSESEAQQILIPIEECSIQNGVCLGKMKVEHIFVFKIKGLLLQAQMVFFNFSVPKKSQLAEKIFKLNISQIKCLNKEVCIYEQGLWTKVSFAMKPNKASSVCAFKFKGQSLELFPTIKINGSKEVSTKDLQDINLDDFIKQTNQINFDFFIRQKQKVHKASYYSSASAKKNISKHQQQNLFMSFKFKMRHQNQEYQIPVNKAFSIQTAFEVTYNSVQELQQYNLKNASADIFVIKQGDCQWQLNPDEEITLDVSKIHCRPFESMFSEYSLNDKIDDEGDQAEIKIKKPQKCQHFFIQLQKEQSQTIHAFQKIGIRSSTVGQLKLKLGQGYQVIGKIKGRIAYKRDKQIDLWIVPIRRGRIVLPDVWIEQKKGIWLSSPFIDVQ